MCTRHGARRACLEAMAGRADAGEALCMEAARVILFATEGASRSVPDTIRCPGGNGCTHNPGAGRLLRDARLYGVGAAAPEIRRMPTGRGLPR